ncbi:uncharacterized protein KY384_004889 [Bacidia gigantensis]|uniref:uncharacterized protein n=1 Tax=Bacidia gigantensis TaxID=2732470 RepID=UPI001D051214|nr:uncharacterized protein KY384_004889 [Bacidia gigantensis]KAG8530387.1 hypothetical protein KY384_004889 [Bacidia gigantensis]
MCRILNYGQEPDHSEIEADRIAMTNFYPKILLSMERFAADESLLSVSIYDMIQVFRSLFEATVSTSVAESETSTVTQVNRVATSNSIRLTFPLSASHELLHRQKSTAKLCSISVAMLRCLQPNMKGHEEILEGTLFHLLKIVGQRLDWAMWDDDDFPTVEPEETAQAQVDGTGVSNHENLKSQAPYLIWLLEKLIEVAAKFPQRAPCDMKAIAATTKLTRPPPCNLSRPLWIKLQHTLIKAVFGEEGTKDFEPFLHKQPAPEANLPESQPSRNSEDSRTNFKKEVWRILGWDVLGVYVNEAIPEEGRNQILDAANSAEN